jgi:hypothetical protein
LEECRETKVAEAEEEEVEGAEVFDERKDRELSGRSVIPRVE